MIKMHCTICNKIYFIEPYRLKKSKYCSFKCYWQSKKGQHTSPKTEFKKGQFTGEKHPNWNGGIMHMKTGYIYEKRPDHPYTTKARYVYQHRLIVEQYLGRYLLKKEIVHHLNGIRNDNRIENLIVIPSNSEHQKLHPPWNKGIKGLMKPNRGSFGYGRNPAIYSRISR